MVVGSGGSGSEVADNRQCAPGALTSQPTPRLTTQPTSNRHEPVIRAIIATWSSHTARSPGNTSAANAFNLIRHNFAGDNSARALARRFAGMESPLRAAWPRQGTGTPKAPARAAVGISDPADSSGRPAIPTTAVTEPTAAARSPTESATVSARRPARGPAVSAGPPAGPAAGSVRSATKAAGAGRHSAVPSAVAEGGAGANPTPLLTQPAVDDSGPRHRAGGHPGCRDRG